MFKKTIRKIFGPAILSLVCIFQLNGQYSNADLKLNVSNHVMWVKANFSDKLNISENSTFDTNSISSIEDFGKYLPDDYDYQSLKNHFVDYSKFIINFNKENNTSADLIIESIMTQLNDSVDDDIEALPECFAAWYNNQVMIEITFATCVASTCIPSMGTTCAICWVGSMAATTGNTILYNQCMGQY